jgi:hypothetical protein
MPERYAVVPALGGLSVERVHRLGVLIHRGTTLGPVPPTILAEHRGALGAGARLVDADAAAARLAAAVAEVTDALRSRLADLERDAAAAGRFVADAAALAAAPADDDTPKAIAGYIERIDGMVLLDQAMSGVSGSRDVERLARVPAGEVPLRSHPVVAAALDDFGRVGAGIAAARAAVRAARDALGPLHDRALAAGARRISSLEGKLERAARKSAPDQKRLDDITRQMQALAAELAALTAPDTATRQGGEPA